MREVLAVCSDKCHYSANCETLQRQSGRDEEKSPSKKILQTLNYIFGLFMKYSPHFEREYGFSFTLASLSLLVCCVVWCEGRKSMRKIVGCYIRKNSLPKERQNLAKKNSLSALLLSLHFLFTHPFLLSSSSSRFPPHHPQERKKN